MQSIDATYAPAGEAATVSKVMLPSLATRRTSLTSAPCSASAAANAPDKLDLLVAQETRAFDQNDACV